MLPHRPAGPREDTPLKRDAWDSIGGHTFFSPQRDVARPRLLHTPPIHDAGPSAGATPPASAAALHSG